MQHVRKSTLKVLVLGFPRTGQTSIHKLLTTLNYKCYDDGVILRNMRTQIPLWHKAMDPNHDGSEWNRIFGDHTAALGLPTCLYWKQLIECYPECKVVLLKRDRTKWYRSIFQTFGWFHPLIRLNMKILPNWIHYKKYCSQALQWWCASALRDRMVLAYRTAASAVMSNSIPSNQVTATSTAYYRVRLVTILAPTLRRVDTTTGFRLWERTAKNLEVLATKTDQRARWTTNYICQK